MRMILSSGLMTTRLTICFSLLHGPLQLINLAAAIAGEASHVHQICLADVGDQCRIDLNGAEMRRNLLIDFPAQDNSGRWS